MKYFPLLLAALLLTAPALRAGNVISTLGNGETNSGILPTNFTQLARAFTTGSTETQLHSITVPLSKPSTNGTAKVQLWTTVGGGDLPETLVEDLGNFTVAVSSSTNFTRYSSLTPVLKANTRYWVTVQHVSGGVIEWFSSIGTGVTSDIGSSLVNARATSLDGSTWTSISGSLTQLFSVTSITERVVTNTSDAGAGSLRQAILDAASAPGPDRITFAPALSGQTINLTSFTNHGQTNNNSALVITNDTGGVTIDATALPLGISLSDNGGTSYRLLYVSGSTLTLRGLTFRDSGFTAFGNTSGGALHSLNSTVTIERCTFSGNTGDGGGAIYSQSGSMNLNHCTFAGNSAISPGDGGAIFNNLTTMSLTHCTLLGNTSVAGQVNDGGIMNLDATLTLTNTIVAGNTGGDVRIHSGTLICQGKNIIQNLTGTATGSGSVSNAAPQLAGLAYYGGGTATMPPLVGSPAIDPSGGASSSSFATDQRGTGFPRVVNDIVDIGAVEYSATASALSAVVVNTADSGLGSLRATLAAVPSGSTLTFAPHLSGGTIGLTTFSNPDGFGNTALVVAGSRSVALDASALTGGLTITRSSASAFRLFNVPSGSSLALTGLTLTNGNSTIGGGGISNFGTLTLTRCTLTGCFATNGGAIFTNGTATLTHCTLSNNTSIVFGGAILTNGTLALTHCTLSGNTAAGGGGLWVATGTVNLTNTLIAGSTNASGVVVPDIINYGTVTREGVNIVQVFDNGSGSVTGPGSILAVAPVLAPLGNYGGPTQTMPPMAGSPAIDATSATSITDQRGFSAEDGDGNGIALADIGAAEAQVTLVTTATDEDNGTTNPGSGTGTSLREAIADTSGHADIIRFDPAVFDGQPAAVIRLTLGTVIKITRGLSVDARDLSSSVTISGDANGNGTPDSGDTGIFEVDLSGANGANGEHIISLHRLTIKDAYSTNNPGGGILSRGTVMVNQCLLSGNHAANNAGGGGIFNGGTLTVSQSTITGNHADLLGLGGGGIYNGGTLTLNQSTITGNHADNNGSVAGGTGGGGIANDGTLIVNQSTITGNHADNALGGGGIHSRGTDDIIVLTNSLVAGNSITTGTGPDILNSGTPITSSGRTLIGKTDDSSTTWNVNDLTGTSASPLEALLAPLASNGGLTPTVALLPGSPAMNARLTPSEVQRIIVYNAPADSTFTITFNGQTTAPVVFNASPAVIQSALEALSTVGAANVIVTGNASFFGSLGNYIVAFRGTLAATDQPSITAQMAVGSPGAVAVFVTTLVEGGSTAVTTDQRGFPIVGTADLGAYESQGSTVTLTSADNPAVFGTSLTFTATVNELDPDVITPTGTVTFTVDNVPGSPVPLNASGIATFTTSALNAGAHTITATYNGDARLLASTSSTLNQTVLDLTVGNGNDNGPFSLRQALANAATHPGPDTITLPIGLNGQTLTLLTQLVINDAGGVTIDASGLSNGFTISGGGNVRLFTVAAGSTVTLKNLTLINGKGVGGSLNGIGGAIYNNTGATLTLDGCTLSGHASAVGGAIFNNGGVLTLTRCAFTGNAATDKGGAVNSTGGLTARGCAFSGNTATSSGGALYSGGTASLTNCTFTANAGQDGGGVFNQFGGVLALTHCTLAVNSAISSGGGIASGIGALTLTNCIVAQNTAVSGADLMNSGSTPFGTATVTRVGVNIVRSHVNSGNTATDTGPTALNADPLLNVLGNYGGPTPTMPLLPASPALDQASVLNPALTTDQRGFPRPVGVRPDIGAVEGTVIVVTTPVDELDAPGALGNGVSLREAVRDVEAGGTVVFDRAVFNSTTTNTLTLTKGPLNPQRNCTLNGALNPGGIKIVQMPTITAQPQPQSVASNALANFAIAVTNLSGGVAYAWRKNGTPNGTTAAALNFANAQEGDEGVYDVLLSEAAAPGTLTLTSVVLGTFAATSQPASLIVDGSAVAIKRHPANAMIALGSSHTLSVVAAGPGTLTYQWTLNGKNISGATKASYLIAKAALTHAGTYRCVVKSGAATATSDPAEIGVVDTTPKTVNLLASPTASFTATVNAAGNGLGFAWLKNGGGTAFAAKSFNIKPALITDSGLYTCTVTGAAGTFTGGAPTQLNVSNAAPALVTPLQLPAATIGQTYFYQLPVTQFPGAPATSFSIAGALPTGLVFNNTTGILSGRPTVTKTSGYALSFKAINAKGPSPAATATLTVNVVPPTAVGVFAGPVERSPLNDNLGGRFDLTTTAAGGFSGSLTLGARAKLGFTAQLLQSAGTGDVILYGNIPGLTMADKTPLTAYIEIFATEQLARLTLIHPNGTTLVIPAWRNQWVFSTKPALNNPASIYAAYYTMRLDPQDLGTAPRGYGYASFTVKPDGTLTLAGKLPDGSAVTGGTYVGPDGHILLFNLLYANRGSHVGQFTLTPASPVTNNAVSGATSWFKPGPLLPTSTDTVYKAGFGPLTVTAAGGVYVPPAKGLRVMGLLTVPNPNAKLSFTLGGLAPEFTQAVNIVNPSATGLTNTALITAPATNTTKLPTLDSAKGLFAGSFQINGATAALHRPAPFFGQIVKIGASTQGYGYFLLPTATPKISTSPKLSGRVVLGVP